MTGTAPTPAPPPAEYRCRCGHVLGEAEGRALRAGGVRILGRPRIQCPRCGRVQRYCPPPASATVDIPPPSTA